MKNSHIEDDPYDRMITFLTGKRKEERKSKEKAIRFPVKLMYIIQCGDFNHLIDWVDEEDTAGPDMCIEDNRNVTISGTHHGGFLDEPYNNHVDNRPTSTAFIIYDTIAFEKHVLPAIFKEGKFDSFERKLYRWGFAKKQDDDPPAGSSRRTTLASSSSIYEHPYFCKGDYATASTIACSGSEVKRYKQMQKDKKKLLRKSRITRKDSSFSSSICCSSSSFATKSTSSSTYTTRLTNDNITPLQSRARTVSTPAETSSNLLLYRKDRWDALYFSALRNSPSPDEETVDDRDIVYREESLVDARGCAHMATSSVHYESEQEEQKNEEIGEIKSELEHLGITQMYSSTERNSSRTGISESGESITEDVLSDIDILLVEQLRTRYNRRQRTIEKMQLLLSKYSA
ncbi:predicted protein [Chaetoceros tenuissimus]|uniref:HSF-type DNA-binding domain-containing protein n=1 Tax=Chaetoceros tenuissimus TaxID=426638 RepID=A0AAD3CWG1_9STRA|nr:predicted protein [Chaetoceros tenuissimus]